jgi:hypothetical protein
MGFRGETPYRFELRRGQAGGVAWFADFAAAEGGIAGRCLNPAGEELLFHLPLRIAGLSENCPAALWRADRDTLEWFGVHAGTGYVTFDADRTIDFYAGNIAVCDPALAVEIVRWDADNAAFRLHNPTAREIRTRFRTVGDIPGRKALDTEVTLAPGASVLLP